LIKNGNVRCLGAIKAAVTVATEKAMVAAVALGAAAMAAVIIIAAAMEAALGGKGRNAVAATVHQIWKI
jgi:hypothetical protein